MNSFTAIIDAIPDFSGALNIPESHARTMKARDSIPPEYWPDLVEVAAKQNIQGVTYERLSALRKNRFAATPKASAPEEHAA